MISTNNLITKPSRVRFGSVMILMMVSLAACSSNKPAASSSATTQIPAPTTQVPSTGQSISTPGSNSRPAVLFQDDFSVPSTDWNVFDSGDIIREYADGEFRAYVDNDKNPHRYPIAFVGRAFGDVRLEVDFHRASGSDAVRAHLVCRRAGEQEYVFGSIDFQGEARIGTFLGDMQEIVASEVGFDISPSGVNSLRLDCVGSTISLYVNGELAVTTPVETVAEGSVGFAAGGATEGQTDIRFDNFVVYPVENQGASVTQANIGGINACELITKEEAEAALASPVGDPIEEIYPPIYGCRYESTGFNYVSVSVIAYEDAKQAEVAFQVAIDINSYTEVSGIGDRASRGIIYDISVLKGKYELSIDLSNDEDDEIQFEKAKTLAALVVDRLP